MMYGNPYYGSPQVSTERIDAQIRELEAMRAQAQKNSHPSINQTFQLAPAQNGLRFVESIDDVNKELVFTDSVFFNKDMSTMWVKNTKGQAKTYEIKEVVEKDEKDIIIDKLMARLEKLERGEEDAKSDTAELDEHTSDTIQE